MTLPGAVIAAKAASDLKGDTLKGVPASLLLNDNTGVIAAKAATHVALNDKVMACQ